MITPTPFAATGLRTEGFVTKPLNESLQHGFAVNFVGSLVANYQFFTKLPLINRRKAAIYQGDFCGQRDRTEI